MKSATRNARGFVAALDWTASMQSPMIFVYPPSVFITRTAAGSWTDPHPALTNAFVILSSARCTTVPPNAANVTRGGYPRPDHNVGYAAAKRAQRRGQLSISR